MSTIFEKKVYAVAKRIPRGHVVTYKMIARAIGRPQAVRAIGNALHKNPFASVPCHRVVRSDGRLGGFNRGAQRKRVLLQKEGVMLHRGRIHPFYLLTS